MKVYVAGSWDARQTCREIANHVASKGHVVLSNWLYWEPPEDVLANSKKLNMLIKKMDCDGVRNADAIIVFTEVPSTKHGFYFETGMAEGWNALVRYMGSQMANLEKIIYMIGKQPEDLCAFLAGYRTYPTLDDFYHHWPKMGDSNEIDLTAITPLIGPSDN